MLSHNRKHKIRAQHVVKGSKIKFLNVPIFKDEEVIILPNGYFLQAYLEVNACINFLSVHN